MDIFAVLITMLDIVVKCNTTLIYDTGATESNKTIISNFYCNQLLIMDALAALPVDYIAIMTTGTAIAWIRLLRLLKFFRVKEILK